MYLGKNAHLSYCTNIHPGETWEEVFTNLKKYCIEVKSKISPSQSFGIGLRLSQRSAEELLQGNRLSEFKNWLETNNLYVFTMNGFPFGNFHHVAIKDQVHSPDWTTSTRVAYTKNLIEILAYVLPNGVDGGISTSPLSYKLWFAKPDDVEAIMNKSALSLVSLVIELVRIKKNTGKVIHMDIEPEPDGLLENSSEVAAFFKDYLLKVGISELQNRLKCSKAEAREYILLHIQICYDVCHFSLAYEEPTEAITKLMDEGIRIGKIQISAALKCIRSKSISIQEQQQCLKQFDEPVYLHQSVVKQSDGSLKHFPDLNEGIQAMKDENFKELRAHFHIPIFVPRFQVVESTQSDIVKVLSLWRDLSYSNHLEVETYTWSILPQELQTDLTNSIVRELQWVMVQLEK